MLLENLHVFLYITAALYAVMMVYAVSRPPNMVNRELTLIMLVCTVWVYSYTGELDAHARGLGHEVMLAWMRVRFMALPFLVPLWLMLVASVSGFARRVSGRWLWVVFAVPAAVALLSATPGALEFFRRGFVVSDRSKLLEFEHAAMGYVYMAYVAAGIALGIGMVAAALRRHGARRDLVLLMFSAVIPVTHGVIILYPSGRGVMLAPALLLPMAVALILASVHYNLCDMAPFVARRQFFDGALEGVVILDPAGVVLEHNRAAAEGFDLVGLGKVAPGARLGPAWMPEPWGAVFSLEDDPRMTFQCANRSGSEPATLWYERARVPVMEKGVQVAWLFTIADITDRVALREREAEEIRQASENTRARQWHGLLRDLHDGIGPVSTTIGLLAERALRAKDAAEKDGLIEQISDYAENGHVELRTMMNMMEYKTMSWQDIEVEARRFSRLILEPRGIALAVTSEGEPPAEPPPVTAATSLLRIIKEAVHNTAKHSGATEMGVTLAFTADALRLTVRDNGSWQKNGAEGRGLRHIRQRVAELRGSMVLRTAPETRLTCIFPLAFAGADGPGAAPGEEQHEYLHCRG